MSIIKINDVKDSLSHYYKTGGGKTYYFGFNTMSKFYSIKEGGCTDWTGYGGSGKTELLLEGLKNQSDWHNLKHLIHMPDAGTKEEVIAKIMHKMSGKPFEEFYYDKSGKKRMIENRMTEAEMFRMLPDVLEYFKIFNNFKGSRSKSVTPVEFWEYAAENKRKLGIFSGVIDSWNYMRHDLDGYTREDKWLEATLSQRNEIAEANDLHFHTIIHPRSAKKDKSGKIIMPDMHSLKGGSEWSNNGKTIIIVHRDFDSGLTEIKIDKAKPKIVGVQGFCNLRFSVGVGGFYENINGKRHYAHKDPIEVIKQPKKQATNPNERIESGSNDDLNDLPF